MHIEVAVSDENQPELKEEIEKLILKTSLVELSSLGVSPESTSAPKALIERLSKFGCCIKCIKPGSVKIIIMCPSFEALEDLRELYISGRLTDMFINAYIIEENRQSVILGVTVDETEWLRCRAHLSTGETLFDWIHLFCTFVLQHESVARCIMQLASC